jgi:dihydrofolate synthase/folylpolyglutamate synthase
MLSYTETLAYLFSKLPMFQRVGPAAYKADLTNTLKLCRYLKNPEHNIKCIHIAGTNGKGSSSHMLAAILQSCGYKTGLYTSPHLLDFTERIKVNGTCIAPEYITSFVHQHKSQFDAMDLSFFEWTVGLAFQYFKDQNVDIAVIETGLGGRLDSTNVIHPIISLITNIGYDHQALLGNTLPQIAQEKAGIIKAHCPVVISSFQEEIAEIFIKSAAAQQAPLYFASKEWRITSHLNESRIQHVKAFHNSTKKEILIPMDLCGHYQLYNLPGVLKTCDVLCEMGYPISESKIIESLSRVQQLTGFMGRWQIISNKPLTIADTAHNSDGLRQIIKQLQHLNPSTVHMVFGMVRDKSPEPVLNLLPLNYQYYFVSPDLPRGLPANDLAQMASNFNIKGIAYESVWKGFIAAQQAAADSDIIYIGGSTFVVADFLKEFSL